MRFGGKYVVSLYDLILHELEYAKVIHHDVFGQFYTISLGAHLFNLANKGEYEYDAMGNEESVSKGKGSLKTGKRVLDTRLHIMFVTPPGFGKTYFIEQFIEGLHSIVPQRLYAKEIKANEYECIPCKIALNTTGAGFTGTVRQGPTNITDEGKMEIQGVQRAGLAQRYSTGILGFDEFSDLTEMMKRKHSRELDTALLKALDSGIMTRDLAPGSIDYRTGVTLWAGTQPERFDMSSGLARRLIFLRFTPTKKDQNDIRWAMRRSISMRWEPVNINTIHHAIMKLKKDVWSIDHAEFDVELYDFIDHIRETRDIKILHPDEIPIYRVVVGYWMTKHEFWKDKREIVMTLNDELRRLIEQEVLWRWSIKKGGEFGELEMILEEHYREFRERDPKGPYGGMNINELQKELVNFGLDLQQSRKRIYAFAQAGQVELMPNWKNAKTVRLTKINSVVFGGMFGNDKS